MDGLSDLLSELARIVVDIVFYIIGFMLNGVSQLLRLIGLKGTLTSHTTLTYVLALIILAAFTYFTIKIVSKWVYNSIIGLIALFILHIIGFDVPLNLFTILMVAFFGVGGLIAVLVLYLAGVFPNI